MKTKLTKIITIIAVAIAGAITVVPAPMAHAACSNVCDCDSVPEEVKKASGCPGVGEEVLLKNVVINILNAVIGFLAFVAVIFIIIGGISYMTSQGDPGKIKKAKDTILYACIGLAVCAFSFAIVNFAIGIINGSDGNS